VESSCLLGLPIPNTAYWLAPRSFSTALIDISFFSDMVVELHTSQTVCSWLVDDLQSGFKTMVTNVAVKYRAWKTSNLLTARSELVFVRKSHLTKRALDAGRCSLEARSPDLPPPTAMACEMDISPVLDSINKAIIRPSISLGVRACIQVITNGKGQPDRKMRRKRNR
jgi:hypothetical protein